MIMEKKYINMELNINMDITSEGDKALFIQKKVVSYEIKNAPWDVHAHPS